MLCLAAGHIKALSQDSGTGSNGADWQLALEQKHFLQCLAFVYDPALWFSYRSSLFFAPKDDAQAERLVTMKLARARYVALTNRFARYQLAARVMAQSGVGASWQKKLLLPYSETNQNLTPTLPRPLRIIAQYEVVQRLPEGDALIAAEGATNLVMDFGRATDDAFRTNAALLKEGEKILTTPAGGRQALDAFTDVGLNKEETAALKRVAVAFQQQAEVIDPETVIRKSKEEFQNYLARAKDSSPYIEYLLARCYLEGRGTQTNLALGMEWMQRAARSGSGDAKTYLERFSGPK